MTRPWTRPALLGGVVAALGMAPLGIGGWRLGEEVEGSCVCPPGFTPQRWLGYCLCAPVAPCPPPPKPIPLCPREEGGGK